MTIVDVRRTMRNQRGVALLVVLLVTALMIALIFEFAYGTRISLRAAVNFRDSQRALFLARSGVNFAGALLSDNLKNSKPLDNIEQLEWQTVPIVSTGDAELKVRWEDESGKVSTYNGVVRGNEAYTRLSKLFDLLGINQSALDQIVPSATDNRKFYLLTEFHQYLSEEDFGKIKDLVTSSKVDRININTAPSEVLQSLGLSAGVAGMIVDKAKREPFDSREKINAFSGMDTAIAGKLDVTSNVFKVNSFATVGGYTKQVEAIITRSTSGFEISYWRAL